mmetsp:Transcript_93861/g.223228  ORF Transcript_93861/g.223228 Transcript_93861/m.223228 type:complete len:245 (+) Transcript_93861:1375-2109(+)
MLYVVVGASHAFDRLPGAPHQAIQKCRQQCGRSPTESLHTLRVASEQGLAAIVIHIAVCPDGKDILQDGLGTNKCSAVNGPIEGRNGLCSHSDVQELLGSMTSRNHFHGLLELKLLVAVDRLHDQRRAFGDGSHQNLRHERHGPAEALDGLLVVDVGLDQPHGGGHEGGHHLTRHPIAYMSQADGGQVFHGLLGPSIQLQGQANDLVGHKVDTSGGLLEEGLRSGHLFQEVGEERLAQRDGVLL